RPVDPTVSWAARAGDAPTGDDAEGFTPKQAIAPQPGRQTISEPPAVVRARLRELPIVYILILASSTLWRYAMIGPEGLIVPRIDEALIGVLVGLIALLWSRWPISLAGLKALELGMIGVLAGRVAFVQYWLMREFSLRGDVMLAQITLKNVVLLTAVLILTYG